MIRKSWEIKKNKEKNDFEGFPDFHKFFFNIILNVIKLDNVRDFKESIKTVSLMYLFYYIYAQNCFIFVRCPIECPIILDNGYNFYYYDIKKY